MTTTFAFLHGAWHGAWCWSGLAEQLRLRGHGSVAVDLPIEDPSAGAEAYAAALVDGVRAARPRGSVVVVGHSLGGTAVPLAAAALGADRMVFLTALMPEPGLSLADIAARSSECHAPGWAALSARALVEDDGATSWRPEDAVEAFYHDCSRDSALRWALMLRRQYGRAFDEITPVRVWPDIPTSVIVASQDRVLGTPWHRENALRRTGTAAIEIDTGHSPMCARPAELADILVSLGDPS